MPQESLAELLAMLTTQSPRTEPSGGRRTGAPRFTQHDVAAMMAGLEFEEVELLRVKYGGESSAKLRGWWLKYLSGLDWGNKPEVILGLCEVTLDECLHPNICRTCSGAKQLPNRGTQTLTTCPTCDGTGRQKANKAAIARYLGVGSRLNKPWDERLNEARQVLASVEYAGLAKMERNRGLL